MKTWMSFYDGAALVLAVAAAISAVFNRPEWAAMDWAAAAYMKVCAFREELRRDG